MGIGLKSEPGLAYAQAAALPAVSVQSPWPDKTLVELPYTDGYGLLPKLPAFSKIERTKIFLEGKSAYAGPCITPFSQVLGSADGVKAHSNCCSTCIRLESLFLDLRTGEVSVHQQDPKQDPLLYIGVLYQCVKYVRKWWIKNKGITFGSADSAYEIIYLTEGTDIRTQEAFLLARSINGAAKRPPKRGDLVVYYADRDDPKWRHGHVAVVVAVDLNNRTVALAEENYGNEPWQAPNAFARQVQLFEVGGRYTLLDVPVSVSQDPKGGRILGWVYPLSDK